VGDRLVVNLKPSSAHRFFRLRRPGEESQ